MKNENLSPIEKKSEFVRPGFCNFFAIFLSFNLIFKIASFFVAIFMAVFLFFDHSGFEKIVEEKVEISNFFFEILLVLFILFFSIILSVAQIIGFLKMKKWQLQISAAAVGIAILKIFSDYFQTGKFFTDEIIFNFGISALIFWYVFSKKDLFKF